MNITSFRPRNAYVLVKRMELTRKQTGGIILPTNEYGNFAFAIVRAIGPGNASVSHDACDLEDMNLDGRMADCADLEVGDTILIKTGRDADLRPGRERNRTELTLPFTVNGEKVELLNEQAVIAVVTLGDPDNDD